MKVLWLTLGLLTILLMASITLAQTYSSSGCEQIKLTIANIEKSKSNYTNLTLYSYYSRLADKYHQLGECYQDINASYSNAFEEAGKYYEKAAADYIADFSKKYAYLVSAGDSYVSAGDKQNALRVYKEAREILEEHPEINIDTKVINEKISKLLTGTKKVGTTRTNNITWVIGVFVFLIVIGGVYYITKKY